jgi:hypothetical protein
LELPGSGDPRAAREESGLLIFVGKPLYDIESGEFAAATCLRLVISYSP